MNYLYNVLERMKARCEFPKMIIDAGAHFGETNDMFRAMFPGSRVISFEANPNCESILKEKGIEYVIGLLGEDTVEKVTFYINPDDITSTGCSTFRETGKHFQNAQTVELPMYALDAVIPEGLDPDFLKMDVQGAELSILKGGWITLKKIKWIYLEVSFVECNKGAPLFEEINSYIVERGYRIVDMCDPTYINNQLLQCNFLYKKI